MITHFVGIDVQIRRGCPCAVLRSDGTTAGAVWANNANDLRVKVEELLARDGAKLSEAAVGIDAPRMELPEPRPYYWNGSRGTWRARESSNKGYGRHCEVAVSAYGLGKPQWTPTKGDSPPWMQLGFALYEAFSAAISKEDQLHEVFPSASYTMLRGHSVKLQIDVSGFSPGPRDMLDAYVAAATVREYECGAGCRVGGGDGLGTITLPRPLPKGSAEVLTWPAKNV